MNNIESVRAEIKKMRLKLIADIIPYVVTIINNFIVAENVLINIMGVWTILNAYADTEDNIAKYEDGKATDKMAYNIDRVLKVIYIIYIILIFAFFLSKLEPTPMWVVWVSYVTIGIKIARKGYDLWFAYRTKSAIIKKKDTND